MKGIVKPSGPGMHVMIPAKRGFELGNEVEILLTSEFNYLIEKNREQIQGILKTIEEKESNKDLKKEIREIMVDVITAELPTIIEEAFNKIR